MIIEYCRNDDFNFGDDLNNWLWPKLLGDCLSQTDGIYFVGIGTLLTKKRFAKALAKASTIVIFSSGAWDRNIPKLDQRSKVYGVRGPRTAKSLGVSNDLVVGDGAYLLREIDFEPVIKRYKTAFIPHHRSEDYVDWPSVCKSAGVTFISTRQPVDSFINQVRSCEKIISEAMHGAIAADIFRIPWIGARFAPNFNNEKWLDWCDSMDITLELHDLPLIYEKTLPVMRSFENAIKRAMPATFNRSGKWKKLPVSFRAGQKERLEDLADSIRRLDSNALTTLSKDQKLASITHKLQQQLEKIRLDYLSNSL
ncbi:polysaccharide pyruvyl transferase family protein [Marinobacter alexandrii]|jgi:succinoglycan biosynthesis protein ExoV|uniref:polysaccharide pyruvyl transferase family protein n=1 Tax=Marinobacter alexandrii TaxID=2570351 RepID=UPI002ABE733C|nr:polysaccharide pyruvyl transferase family protein [Marinobacter alexandrii]